MARNRTGSGEDEKTEPLPEQNDSSREFIGIFVDKRIIHLVENKEITPTEGWFLANVDTFKSECFARNSYLAKKCGVTRRWLKRVLQKLLDSGYLIRRLDRKGRRILETPWKLSEEEVNDRIREQEKKMKKQREQRNRTNKRGGL